MYRPTKKSALLSFFSLLTILLITSCSSSKSEFSKKDVKSSQKLIGLDFDKKYIDTLYPYLKRNKEAFDSLRKYTLDNDIIPAVRFDPLPLNFTPKAQTGFPEWEIPDNVPLPSKKSDLAFYSIPQLASLIKNQKISSLELTEFFIARLKKYNPILECTITVTEEMALEQAKLLDAELAAGNYRGILHGIPYGVKDLMAVKSYKTTWGAEPYRNQQIEMTATVVEKLQTAGGILVAKLVSGSLARGDVWFDGKTKNPWDTTQGATGSSAGSGSATSAGLVPFSLGTETLGSITSPSNRNGITGLRPTYGRVSRHGVMSLSWSMDKVGPMARSAEDCAIVYSIITGKDPKDGMTTDYPDGFEPKKDYKSLRIGYLKKDIEKDTSLSKGNLEKALKTFQEMGITLTEVELPKDVPYNSFDIILRAEAGAFFDDMVRAEEVDKMVEQTQRSRANSLRQSRFIPAVEYIQANRHRQVLIEKMQVIMKDFDIIISPTFGNRQLIITNLTGHPVIAIPTGLDKEKHPTSITLVGNLYDEASILLLAKAFQDQTEFDEMHPEGYTD
ncbi:Asp-tRNA(Asn)/Glu-tRNA(Gln) amidotransferase A subunit family amidase [Maribacter caenipelagi]|uniref:Asp-tRNA(Asn)/Glu-tRNA(Gln) amidotransferase A subunit family amidase n=1 Tax=Maribacter caenipelagi TaxID=1447781 RepID=A0A4R7CZH0_9FLAO|nr:amidase [Maribacter caenipelagi]TDS12584.1 Asp-tRNA(Asn)/Glu-tRNA(Gln) amidotransferase A subunit family amidase [Maribacter caenipelagi]